MATITSPYVLYVGTTAYDLRKVITWSEPKVQPVTPIVQVRFQSEPMAVLPFTKSTFETAMQAAQTAGY